MLIPLNFAIPLSWIVTAMGTLVFIAGVRISFLNRLSLALEFWTAAGLLRLSHDSTWEAIVVAGTIIVIRKIAILSLKSETLR